MVGFPFVMLVFWRVKKWKGSDRGDINILGKIISNFNLGEGW